jgi:hypothetical protein
MRCAPAGVDEVAPARDGRTHGAAVDGVLVGPTVDWDPPEHPAANERTPAQAVRRCRRAGTVPLLARRKLAPPRSRLGTRKDCHSP